MKSRITRHGGPSKASSLEPVKTLLLFSMIVIAINVPNSLGRIPAFREREPALVAMIAGAITGLIAYAIIKLVFTEFSPSTAISTASILGLVTAHVGVFEIEGALPSIPTTALFIFVVYYHLDSSVKFIDEEGNIIEEPK